MSTPSASEKGAEEVPVQPDDSCKEHFDTKVHAVEHAVETNVLKRGNAGNAFGDTDSLEEFYKPIDTYEGLHRYDPSFQWEPKEEKQLVRKVCISPPLYGCPWSMVPLTGTIDRFEDLCLGLLRVSDIHVAIPSITSTDRVIPGSLRFSSTVETSPRRYRIICSRT